MPTWEIVGLVILGLALFALAVRIGAVGLFLEILLAILTGGRSGGGGSGFGGGSSGGGGSSSKW